MWDKLIWILNFENRLTNSINKESKKNFLMIYYLFKLIKKWFIKKKNLMFNFKKLVVLCKSNLGKMVMILFKFTNLRFLIDSF